MPKTLEQRRAEIDAQIAKQNALKTAKENLAKAKETLKRLKFKPKR
jgi:hypothetical protein